MRHGPSGRGRTSRRQSPSGAGCTRPAARSASSASYARYSAARVTSSQGLAEGLAGVERDQQGQPPRLGAQRAGGATKDLGALAGRRAGPERARPIGGGEGRPAVGRLGVAHLDQRPAGGRMGDRPSPEGRHRAPVAVDQELARDPGQGVPLGDGMLQERIGAGGKRRRDGLRDGLAGGDHQSAPRHRLLPTTLRRASYRPVTRHLRRRRSRKSASRIGSPGADWSGSRGVPAPFRAGASRLGGPRPSIRPMDDRRQGTSMGATRLWVCCGGEERGVTASSGVGFCGCRVMLSPHARAAIRSPAHLSFEKPGRSTEVHVALKAGRGSPCGDPRRRAPRRRQGAVSLPVAQPRRAASSDGGARGARSGRRDPGNGWRRRSSPRPRCAR